MSFELKTVELINIWSYLYLHLKKFNFNFILTHSPVWVQGDLRLHVVSSLNRWWHSLLGKSRHVKACDRRQMFALPLSRRVSASKGLCAAQIYWHQVTKKENGNKTGAVSAILPLVPLVSSHIHTLNNK